MKQKAQPRVVILGAGTAGTVVANKLAKRGGYDITIIDQSRQHFYQPGLLFVPFGLEKRERLVKPREQFFRPGIKFVQDKVTAVRAGENRIARASGPDLEYDVLVVATGCRIAPEETPGLKGADWRKRIFDFYTPDGAQALADKLATWSGGHLVVQVMEMPIKCPVAPLEFAFLSDWFFRQRRMRDRVKLTFVTPLSGAFTKPQASKKLGHLLKDKGVELVADFYAEKVDPEAHKLVCYDGREVPYDLLVTVPVNTGMPVIRSSGLGDDLGFISTDKHTLQSAAHPNVFVCGDASNVPTSKAGSVADFEADTVVDNIGHFIAGQELEPSFDGHANCFVEIGDGRALLLDFNYDTEPVEGTFPFPWVGPMRLLGPSRINHIGKLAFRLLYWYMLLPARRIPGITDRMTRAGKHLLKEKSA